MIGRYITRKREWGLIAGWVLLALVLDLFWIEIYGATWVFANCLPFGVWLGAAALACLIALRGFRAKDWVSTLILLCALGSFGAAQALTGDRISLLARFYALKPRYESVVGAVRSGMVPQGGPRYLTEKGPPLRVAFPWPGGILDNWCGIVYDPSGLVRKAMLIKRDFSNCHNPDFDEVKTLFGGQMCSCEPLGGGWYYCCFT